MELLLIKDKLWDVIKKEAPTPLTSDWQDKDDQARASIGLAVESSQEVHIRYAKSAREAWTALKAYHHKSTMSGQISLLKRLCRLTLPENGNMEDHVTEFLDIHHKLSDMGETLKDKLAASLLLASVPDSYGVLISAIEAGLSKGDVTLEFVKNKLNEEFRRRLHKDGNEESNEFAMKSVATKAGGSEKKCFFCKKSGHVKNDCTKFKAWKKKKNAETMKSSETANKVENVSSDSRYFAKCVGIFTNEACLSAKQNNWIIDSGATSHMVNERVFFT